MQLIDTSISLQQLTEMAKKMDYNLVKAVVDVERGIMVVDAPLHSDEETFLLDEESQQEHLWGINIFPAEYGKDGFIVFDSMINVRPWEGNKSRNVENQETQKIIIEIVTRLVKP